VNDRASRRSSRHPAFVGALVTLTMFGCAGTVSERTSAVPITPAQADADDVSSMLVGRWDGQQDMSWGYGRTPFRTLIIDRVYTGGTFSDVTPVK